MEFKLIVFTITAILLLFLIFKEIKRGNKINLAWRLLASFLMVLSFAFLVVPVTFQTTKNHAINQLNIITEGASLATIAQIKGDKYDLDSSLFSANKNLNIKHLEDLAYYLQVNKDIKKINIYGYGLEEAQLKQLQNQQVLFHPSVIPQGFISAYWQNEIKETQSFILQGIYNNSSNRDLKIKLLGFGDNLDSAIVKANSKSKFSFKNQPKQTGKAIYQLLALNGNDTVSNEPIPFEVLKKQPIQVLILASFPDFEYKFLKNWLFENQYQVVFRSQISKDKFSTDFLNRKATAINPINQDLLKQMDVLVIDEDEMAAMTAGERVAINTAVNNGMGLILRLTNSKPSANNLSYGRYEFPSIEANGVSINSANEDIKLSELPFPQTLYLKANLTEQVIFKSTKGKAVVNAQLYGKGKVIVSTIAATYQWELAGKNTDYALFWTTLFSKASRKELKNEAIEYNPKFLTIGSNSSLVANLATNKIPALSFNEIKLNPKQNVELPFKWDAVFWPTHFGWNKLAINNTTENIFVYQKKDWLALKNTIKINVNTNFAKNQPILTKDTKWTQLSETKEFSKWWFYALFLLAAAYLWYEQRFLSN